MHTQQKPNARERLKERGPRTLSDIELVALLLRTGDKESPVMLLADRVVTALKRSKKEDIYLALHALPGMGDTKAGTIIAALELGRRYSGNDYQKVEKASDVYPLLRHFADCRQEQFICVSLNGAHEVLAIRVVSIGTLNKTIVHPREVFSDPLSDRAAAIIVCHNHPSGQLNPSEEDKIITQRLYKAGELLGITLLDHLILSPRGGYFSFVDAGIFFS